MARAIDQSSPEATAAGYRACMIKGAWGQAFRYMTIDAQAGMVGGMLISAAYASDAVPGSWDSLRKVYEKHGLDRGTDITRETGILLPIFKDLEKWFRKKMPAEQQIELSAAFEQTEYTNFRIQGEDARALCTEKGRKSDSRFKCIDGAWFLCPS